MKETGQMFKAPLVRSILDDIKTMTRRIAKDVKHPGWDSVYTPGALAREPQHTIDLACPYGGPGDRIYVRETFVQGHDYDAVTDRLRTHDDAGNPLPMKTWFRATDEATWCDEDGWEANTPWKPAIHMPKALARIWLDITGVRLERLQDISEADCRAEGAHGGHGSIPGYAYSATPLEHFQHIWTSTGGDWAANPWVWVIDFKRIHNHKATP